MTSIKLGHPEMCPHQVDAVEAVVLAAFAEGFKISNPTADIAEITRQWDECAIPWVPMFHGRLPARMTKAECGRQGFIDAPAIHGCIPITMPPYEPGFGQTGFDPLADLIGSERNTNE